MTKQKINLTRKITVRLKPEEYRKVEVAFKATTKRKLSEYIRYVLLEKPVTVYTRDQTLDEGMQDLRVLLHELSALETTSNQAVHRLHTMDRIPDIKQWAEAGEKQRQTFMNLSEEIKNKINQIFDKWLQE